MTGETHRTLREQVGAYALGQLSGERWRAVHAHLAVCAICRADLEEIAPVAGLLGAARDRLALDELGEPEPDVPPLSPALLDEVRAAGSTATSLERGRGMWWASRRDRTDRAGRGPRWVPTAAAAAIGLLIATGVGFAIGSAGGGSAEVPYETVAVRALDPAVRAQARLVAHTWGTEVNLVATGFELGTAYRVTVTDDVGGVVGAGAFIGTGAAEMRCNLNSSIRRADAKSFQVTAPDGEIVLAATV